MTPRSPQNLARQKMDPFFTAIKTLVIASNQTTDIAAAVGVFTFGSSKAPMGGSVIDQGIPGVWLGLRPRSTPG